MSGSVPYEARFVGQLLVTVGVETVALFLVVRYWFRIPRAALANSLMWFAGIWCSSTTLPYLWFVLPRFLKPYALLASVGEALVVVVEAVFYYFVLKLSVRRSLLLSLVCNLASVIVGLLLG